MLPFVFRVVEAPPPTEYGVAVSFSLLQWEKAFELSAFRTNDQRSPLRYMVWYASIFFKKSKKGIAFFLKVCYNTKCLEA